MRIIEPESSFCIEKNFTLSETDYSVLSLLYLPVIKTDSFFLYNTFLQYDPFLKDQGLESHQDFLHLIDFEDSRFLKARERLEAIGLLETYRKEEGEENTKAIYRYRLLPPASPKKFFSDVVLKNLLLQNVSQKGYFRLVSFFKVSESKRNDNFVNISTKFNDIYAVSLSEDDLKNEAPTLDKSYKEIATFDLEKLKDFLFADKIPLEKIAPSYSEIEDLCKLYFIDEKQAALEIEQCLDTDYNFYYDRFKKNIRNLNKYVREDKLEKEKASLGKGDSSESVRIFTSVTPKEYLQAFFHAEPSPFMLNFIEKLRSNFAFDNGIINVILDYSLKRTNKEFNTILMEKVAYTLSAEGIEDCYDAIVTLKKRDFKLNEALKNKKVSKQKSTEEKETKEKEEISKDEILELSKDLDL